MLGIPSMFSYYGAKWRAAPRYPAPRYDTIIEPFAGAAGYAHRYPDHNVILIEKNPKVAATWRYLLRVTASEVRSLPLMQPGQTVNDLSICDEARYLIGWGMNAAAAAPSQSPSKWMRAHMESGEPMNAQFWGEAKRERIANNIHRIRHWRLIEGDYTDAPDIEATWHVDPPYAEAGKHYSTRFTDYAALSAWCIERRGQVMVCENVGATWLPFRPFIDIASNPGKHGGKISREALWTNEVDG